MSSYFLTINFLLTVTLSQQCHMDYLYQNISNILFIKSPKISLSKSEMNISDFVWTDRKPSNICVNSQLTCCKPDIFDLLKVIIKPLLHKLSGQSAVHSRIYDFIIKLKFKVILLMDVFLYNVYKEISPKLKVTNARQMMVTMYALLHSDIRMKLATNTGNKLDIREAILGAFAITKNEIVCVSKEVYNKSMLTAFCGRFGDVIEMSVLRLYQQAMRLESIISQIQDIEVTKECTDDLLKMIICGVCSQQLDFTLYSDVTSNSSNIRICPKYCYNVIRQCMAYYLTLVKSLQFYQRNLFKFSKRYKADLEPRYKLFWSDKSQYKIFADMILYIQDHINQQGSQCRDPLDMKETLKDNDYLFDHEDKLATNTFSKCLNSDKCETLNRSCDSLFNDVLASIDQFVLILKTYINPYYFMQNILAKSCDNIQYDRCWNGKEIGQYHQSMIRFNSSDPGLHVALTTNQRSKITELSNLIYDGVKNLTEGARQKSISRRTTTATIVQVNLIEGSGKLVQIPSDDEDYQAEKSFLDVRQTQLMTNNISDHHRTGTVNQSENILQQLTNKNSQSLIKVNSLLNVGVLIVYSWRTL